MENVIVLTNEEPSKSYQSLSEIRTRAAQFRLDLEGAALVKVDDHGVLTVVDGIDNAAGSRSGAGALIGTLVGVLGGPIGMLLGLTGGALIGSAFEADDVEDASAVLHQLARAIPPGSTALVFVAEEVDPTDVDSLAAGLGSTVFRRSADEVFWEVEIARAAQEEAAKSARAAVREDRKVERHAERQQKWQDFKSKF